MKIKTKSIIKKKEKVEELFVDTIDGVIKSVIVYSDLHPKGTEYGVCDKCKKLKELNTYVGGNGYCDECATSVLLQSLIEVK